MDDKLTATLKKIVGEENCSTSPETLENYRLNGGLPGAVVFPEDVNRLAEVMKAASKEKVKVVPFGSGTDVWRGLLPLSDFVAVSLKKMNKIIEFDQDNQTVHVEAGLLYKDLNQVLKKARLFLPMDPDNEDQMTVGGLIAANAFGPRKLAYGVTKDYLLGLELVLPTGEIVRTGGRTVKNVQDYDNTRFLAGSWGTLAIITKVLFKLKPLPEKETTVLIPADLKKVFEIATKLRNEFEPTALEVMDKNAKKVFEAKNPSLKTEGNALLLVAFAGFMEPVDWQVEELQKLFSKTRLLSEEEAAVAWQSRKELLSNYAGKKGAIRASAALPFTKTAEFISQVRQRLDASYPQGALVAHFGNGHVYLYLDRPPDEYAQVSSFIKEISELAKSLNGYLVVDNVQDLSLAKEYVRSKGEAVLPLLRRIKDAFDPQHILTPNSKVMAYVLEDEGLSLKVKGA